MFGALLWLRCVVLYFTTSVYGDSGIAFEVEYEVNSSSIFVQIWINCFDSSPGISQSMIFVITFIFTNSLKESL